MIAIDRDDASAEFYDGTANGVLLVRKCPHCQRFSAPAVTVCPGCGSTGLDWTPAAGTAALVSWAVPRDRAGATLAVAGLVELTEGPWLRAGIVDAEPERLAAGLALTVRFHRSGDDERPGEFVPVFAPTEEG